MRFESIIINDSSQIIKKHQRVDWQVISMDFYEQEIIRIIYIWKMICGLLVREEKLWMQNIALQYSSEEMITFNELIIHMQTREITYCSEMLGLF